MQKIFRLLLVVAAVIIGAVWFLHWSRTRALDSGEVHVRNQPQAIPSKGAAPATAASQSEPAPEVADNSPAPSIDASDSQSQGNVASLPASETITRNPTTGVVNVGTGKFQLYRQGDLTYRLNTETGQACVLFATNAMWRTPVVYAHGCANHQ